MQYFTIDGWTLLYQMLYYFPWYVGLVMVPMVIRVTIERAIGIMPEMFESSILGRLRHSVVTYESVFRDIAVTVLYFPLFEELIFRGLPLIFFGPLGLVIGSFIWVIMHPAWQLQYLASLPLRKKLIFTLTTCFYYASNAVFYSMMWLNGAGLAAILYHIIHNGWLTLGDILKDVELSAPWKRYKFVRKQPISDVAPIRLKLRLSRLIRKPARKPVKVVRGEPSFEELVKMRFVVRKPARSLTDEVEEVNSYIFVRRKPNNAE